MQNDGFVLTAVLPQTIHPNELTELRIEETQLILSRVEGKVVAFTNRCPHSSAKFSEGEISRHKLFCPDHGYCFDVRNGRILYPADESYRLKRYEVRETDGQIWVKVI
ncbi:MAG: Rieske 2Fe-2S domain-containing protein [Chloroflexota bacterium]